LCYKRSTKGYATAICVGLLICFLATLLLRIPRLQKERDKQQIFTFVGGNAAALQAVITEGDLEYLQQLTNTNLRNHLEDGYIVFPYCSHGLGPAGIYQGYFYAFDDQPVNFEYSGHELAPSGSGYRWQVEGGNRYFYAEKICDYFYYYEYGS